MKLTVRGCLAAAAVSAVVVAAPAFGSTPVHPGRAAHACAAGRGIDTRFGAGDARYLARFVPCVLKREQAQARLGYIQSKTLSQVIHQALGRFVNARQVTPQAAAEVRRLAVKAMIAKLCPGVDARWDAAFGDTASSAITPLEFAGLAGKWLRAHGGVTGAANAVFGVAARRGLMFENGDLQGAVLGVVAVVCS
jgi:hypothetical protein